MRHLVKNIISKKDAKILCTLNTIDFNNSIIKNIISKLENIIGRVSLNKPSYLKIETSKNGHDWHKDTGTNNHMSWCNYGVSILLKKTNNSLFRYRNPKKKYTQEEHYLNAILHSSDEWHMVEKPEKGRTVLLMFL